MTTLNKAKDSFGDHKVSTRAHGPWLSAWGIAR